MGRFSAKITAVRKAEGLKKAEFARRIGVSFSAVDKYERGGDPGIDVLTRIANEFKVSLDWLLFDHGPMKAAAEELARRKMTPEKRRELLNQILDEILRDAQAPAAKPGKRKPAPAAIPEDMLEKLRANHPGDFIQVPLLSDRAAAGAPAIVDECDIEDYILMYRDWVPHPDKTK